MWFLNQLPTILGVLASVIVAALTYLGARRRTTATRVTADQESRDRLIDQLQERIDQLTAELDRADLVTTQLRAVADNARTQVAHTLQEFDELQHRYREALAHLDDANLHIRQLQAEKVALQNRIAELLTQPSPPA